MNDEGVASNKKATTAALQHPCCVWVGGSNGKQKQREKYFPIINVKIEKITVDFSCFTSKLIQRHSPSRFYTPWTLIRRWAEVGDTHSQGKEVGPSFISTSEMYITLKH